MKYIYLGRNIQKRLLPHCDGPTVLFSRAQSNITMGQKNFINSSNFTTFLLICIYLIKSREIDLQMQNHKLFGPNF